MKQATLHVHGGLLRGAGALDPQSRDDEMRILKAVIRSLPPPWRANAGVSGVDLPLHWLEIPYQNPHELAHHLGSLLATYDSWFERALTCRYVLTASGVSGNHRPVFEGNGTMLAHAIGFWTGVAWQKTARLHLRLTDEEHDLAARLAVRYRRLASEITE